MIRKFYIAPHDAVLEHMDVLAIGRVRYIMLYDPRIEGDKDRWEAAGKPCLVNAYFEEGAHEDRWHSHPEVTPLPDPLFEPATKLKAHAADKSRRFAKKHTDHLRVLGVTEEHTVQDVERLASAHNPSMKLRSIL